MLDNVLYLGLGINNKKFIGSSLYPKIIDRCKYIDTNIYINIIYIYINSDRPIDR